MKTPDAYLTQNLENAEGPAQREVAVRLRRIALELFEGKQIGLLKAMGGDENPDDPEAIRRVELSAAWNGRSLCGTDRWTRAVADAVGVPWPNARDYIAGNIDFDQLLASQGQPTVEPDAAWKAFRIAAKLGRSAAEAIVVAEGLRGYSKGELLDTEIAKRFEQPPVETKAVPPTVVDDDNDDPLGGLGRNEPSRAAPAKSETAPVGPKRRKGGGRSVEIDISAGSTASASRVPAVLPPAQPATPKKKRTAKG